MNVLWLIHNILQIVCRNFRLTISDIIIPTGGTCLGADGSAPILCLRLSPKMITLDIGAPTNGLVALQEILDPPLIPREARYHVHVMYHNTYINILKNIKLGTVPESVIKMREQVLC